MAGDLEGLSIEPHVITDKPVVFYTEILPPELVDLMVKELKQMEEDRVPFEDAVLVGMSMEEPIIQYAILKLIGGMRPTGHVVLYLII